MKIKAEYERWLTNVTDKTLLSELRQMNEEEKKDAFYQSLAFGTGGLRGIMGVGTNRMNIYTVGKATQGLADYLNAQKEGASVVIAYDSRICSHEFAAHTAGVLAANRITVWLFGELAPTPLLSFAVRVLHCDAGVMITASHNPAKYNGYKVYNGDGCQITLDLANKISDYIGKAEMFAGVQPISLEDGKRIGLIKDIPDQVLESFLNLTVGCTIHQEVAPTSDLKIVYTPLNGTGNRPVCDALRLAGFRDIRVVPEQENPDGNFPTCPKPNPEERAAFTKAIELGRTFKADLLLATDPDCDRVGVAVPDEAGDFTLLTGNETGCLLLQYILTQKKALGQLPQSPVVLKTIVTSTLANRIAADYGAHVTDTLTGFKFIGEQICQMESRNELDRYVFGFEESYGCLIGTHVRDKDGVSAALLICEMTAFYKQQGKRLTDIIASLDKKYGCYLDKLISFVFEGPTGMQKICQVTEAARKLAHFSGETVVRTDDYLKSLSTDRMTGKSCRIELPQENVIALFLENGDKIVIRPSGTEPKLKCYLTALTNSRETVKIRIEEMGKSASTFVQETAGCPD